MRALILLGGKASRLLPLSNEIPKGFIPIRNVSAVERILAQVSAACSEVAILVPPGDTKIAKINEERHFKLKIWTEQSTPMESVAEYLEASEEPALVWLGDTFLSLDAQAMINHHEQSKARATMALCKTTSLHVLKNLGSVTLDEQGRTDTHPVPDYSNEGLTKAGAYIFEARMAKQIRSAGANGWDMSPVINQLLLSKQFHGFVYEGYRENINYGHDLLSASKLIADYEGTSTVIDASAITRGRVEIGANVSIGSGVVVEEGVCITNSIVLDGVTVARGATIVDSVIGPSVHIGANTLIRRRMVTTHDDRMLNERPY